MNAMPSGAYSSQQGFQEKTPSGYRKYAMQNFSPEQMQLFQQMFGMVGPESSTAKLAAGDQSQFAEMEAPALRQFNELQGGLASRFSGMGMGARNSSGFQNTSNAAASNFAQELQANRQNLQRQAIMDLMGMSNTLLGQRPYTTGLAQKSKKESSGWGGIIGAGIGGLGGLLASGGNPGGALAGAQIGHGIGSAY